MTVSLDLFAAGAQFTQNSVDAALVDDAHALGGNAQTHEALLGLDPEAMVLRVRQETTSGFVVSVGNVVPGYRTLTGNLTDSRHASALYNPHAQPGMGWQLWSLLLSARSRQIRRGRSAATARAGTGPP